MSFSLVILVNFLLLFGLIIIPQAQAQTQDCQLPSSWSGKWSQKDFPQSLIEISSGGKGSIRKEAGSDYEEGLELGTCIQHEKDKIDENGWFFMFKSKDCIKCVLIQDLDKNVLRYKASDDCEAVEKDKPWSLPSNKSLDKYCEGKISTDVPFHYLIREGNVEPIECPFQMQSFGFSYRKSSSNGICSSPQNHAEPCYSDTQFLFNYEACGDQNVEAKAQEIRCIGSWKDGPNKFLIAEVHESSGHHHRGNPHSVSGRYRCFIFGEIRGPKKSNRPGDEGPIIGYNISISEEASCQGLNKHDDGHYTLAMTMYEDKKERGVTDCKFPSWFTKSKGVWTSIDNRIHIKPGSGDSEILLSSKPTRHRRRHHRGSSSSKFRCRQLLANGSESSLTPTTTPSITMLASKVEDCKLKLSCLKLTSLTPSVTQLFVTFQDESTTTKKDFENECLQPNNNSSLFDLDREEGGIILINNEAEKNDTKPKISRCPIRGIYQITGAEGLEEDIINFGCNRKGENEIEDPFFNGYHNHHHHDHHEDNHHSTTTTTKGMGIGGCVDTFEIGGGGETYSVLSIEKGLYCFIIKKNENDDGSGGIILGMKGKCPSTNQSKFDYSLTIVESCDPEEDLGNNKNLKTSGSNEQGENGSSGGGGVAVNGFLKLWRILLIMLMIPAAIRRFM